MSIPLTTIYCVFYPHVERANAPAEKRKGQFPLPFRKEKLPRRSASIGARSFGVISPSVGHARRSIYAVIIQRPAPLVKDKRQEKTKNRGLTRRPARASGAGGTKQARTSGASHTKASARTVKVRAPVTIYGGALTRPCVRDRRRRLSPRRRKPLYRWCCSQDLCSRRPRRACSLFRGRRT